jgi:hypothetical protein
VWWSAGDGGEVRREVLSVDAGVRSGSGRREWAVQIVRKD